MGVDEDFDLEKFKAECAAEHADHLKQQAIHNAEVGSEEQRRALEAAAGTRDYVLAKFQHLSGYKYPLEIYSITNVPSHNCLIMNDHFLLSYVEAEEILREILK